jgi:hypothetical protein
MSASPLEPLGYRSRRLFRQSGFPLTKSDPEHPFGHTRIGAFFVAIDRLLTWWWQTARLAQKMTGTSLFRQFIDIVRLSWCETLNGQAYYLFELYRPEEMARRGEYLARWETKNGLFRVLSLQLAAASGKRSKLQDKVRFAERLQHFGFPTIPVLASFDRGTSTPTDIDPTLLRQDLFTKLRSSKGAQGAGLIKYLGEDRYAFEGQALGRDALVQRLKVQSHTAALILMPRIVNHPDIAALCVETLMAVRIFSIVNERGEPEIVFAMLRILGKLEPTWHSKVEWAAPVDLRSGELGLLTGDIPEACTEYYTHHPITGCRVQGLVLPFWEQLKEIALKTHRALTMDRVVIGWDIAITPAGPCIVEGNVSPDVFFPQHVGRRPFGEGRYGEIFHHHLDRLEARLAATKTERRLDR